MMQNDGAGFLSGAAGGFFGSLGATAWGGANVKWKGIGGDFGSSSVGTIAFGALSGGVGAELSGGNFWQGAITGGIVAGLNDVMHKMDGPGDPPSKYKKLFSSLRKDINLLKDLYGHYQFGGGEDFYYKASSIQLNGATQKSLGLTGKSGEVNLFHYGTVYQALAFGRLEFVRVGNSNQFTITKNKFDFDYQSGASFSRNLGTFAGSAIMGNVFESGFIWMPQPNQFWGGSFTVVFKGIITIPK
jgi:hypothetical protein